MRFTSASIAFLIFRIEFKFLISTLVPSFVSPFNLMEILASQRKLPSSIFPSHTFSHLTNFLKVVTYSNASSDECKQGSVTISSNGVPALFKSIQVLSS